MKVYIASAGSYSDWHVLGVYSTREAAAEHAAQCSRDGDANDPDEYEVDAPSGFPAGMTSWTVPMTRDGAVTASPDGYWRLRRVGAETHPQEDYWNWIKWVSGEPLFAGRKDYSIRIFRVWARDADHAVKIAGERRAQMIAANEWPTEAEGAALNAKAMAEARAKEKAAHEAAMKDHPRVPMPPMVIRKPEP